MEHVVGHFGGEYSKTLDLAKSKPHCTFFLVPLCDLIANSQEPEANFEAVHSSIVYERCTDCPAIIVTEQLTKWM